MCWLKNVWLTGVDDFDTTPLTATFASGTITSNVTVRVINDNFLEGEEEFDLMLDVPPSLGPAIAVNSMNDEAVGIITDSTSKCIILWKETVLNNVWHIWLLVLSVGFARGQFTGSESSEFIEVVVRIITGGTSTTPITVTVTPFEQSPVSAMGNASVFTYFTANVTNL